MKIKAFWSILLTLVLTFSLAAAEGEDQLARIQAQGEIVVSRPRARGRRGRITTNRARAGGLRRGGGMQAIAAKLGVTATFAETEWDGIFAGLDSGRYDMAANGVEITEERAQKYDFSTPYGYIRTALIVRGDNDGHSASFEDSEGQAHRQLDRQHLYDAGGELRRNRRGRGHAGSDAFRWCCPAGRTRR